MTEVKNTYSYLGVHTMRVHHRDLRLQTGADSTQDLHGTSCFPEPHQLPSENLSDRCGDKPAKTE